MKYKIKNSIALLLIPQIIVVKWLGSYPELIERYYSKGIYPIISGFWRVLLGWVPFSVGDILYALLILIAIRYILVNRVAIKRKPLMFLRDIVMVASIAYFSFHVLWGLNYYREPLAKTMELPEKHNEQDLVDFVDRLIAKTNEIHLKINGDTDSMVQVPYSKKEIFDLTLDGYRSLQKQYPILTYSHPSIKKSLLSTPLTYMGYGGYLNPFTNEAQANAKLPNFRFPVISGHEIGHQLGYSAENETNFIGYLVTVGNGDPYFQYSGYAYALSYCLNELARRDKVLFEEQYNKLNPGIRKNYQEVADFWQAHENPLEPVFKSIFNSFLKANNQTQGIRSYHGVVSLLVTYYKDRPL
ncbi:MAG TPA: DUF3810 domain-containing protein [Arenibacter sp.]|nr:DUF3810 domain-containing protein [Arenibacter sp.]